MESLSHEDLCELQEYIQYEGTEISDYLNRLIALDVFSPDHGMSETLKVEIKKDLEHWLARFRNETMWTEERVPQPDKVYKTLEWIDE